MPRRSLRRTSLAVLMVTLGASCAPVLLSSACATRAPSALEVAELGRAQVLVQQGCYPCLRDALTIYERLSGRPRPAPEAVWGGFRAAVLLLARAKELGLPVQPAQERARAWAARVPPPGRKTARELSPAAYLDALQLVQGELSGLTPEQREDLIRERRALWPSDGTLPASRLALAPFTGTDLVAQYVALAVDCEDARARKAVNHEQVLALYPHPLIRFRVALCGIPNQRLEPLRQSDARWVDTLFFEGRVEMARIAAIDLGRAADLFSRAHETFPESVAMTLALGNARNALEDHEPALALFDSILTSQPTHREALLGRLLSLSYLKRHYQAIRAATQMVDLGTYHMGDAYYWRAWNRYQVHELPAAWADVEQASKLMVNTAVFTLAGFIAYAERELDTAIERLVRAYALDKTNCEALWTEGMVHVDKEDWSSAAARFATAVGCFANDAQAARDAVIAVQNSTWAEAIKARRIATAQKRADSSDHRRAQSAFNAASSYLRLQKRSEALRQIDIAAGHPLLTDKAAALRVAIEKLP